MNYKKLKQFNQILLAIGGVIIILLMLFGGGVMVVEFLSYANFNNNYQESSGILADEKVDQLMEDSLRGQIISFNKITVIDSA